MKRLHVPCPQCELLTLVRRLDFTGVDAVDCANCGYDVPEEHYGLWARMILDDMIGESA